MMTGASAGRVRQYASICGRTVVTDVVLRIHPPSVTVSGMTPTLAAALASRSALLPPMNKAGRSLAAFGTVGEMVRPLERAGSESSSSLNFELS